MRENEKVLKYLLETLGKDGIKARGDIGATPLHIACIFGTVDIVRYLLENHQWLDLDINGTTHNGQNLFHMGNYLS